MIASPKDASGRFLRIGWRAMAVWGIGVAALGVSVAVVNHILSPQLLLYTTTDEQFTGVSWAQIQGMGPNFPLWLSLFYDTTATMMAAYGFLTALVAMTAFRSGERWAWLSLLASFLVSSGYLVGTAAPFLGRGLLGISGISIGVPGIVLVAAFLVVGLVLPGLDLRNAPAPSTPLPTKRSKRWSFSWISLAVVVGGLNILFAIFVPLTDHLSLSGAPPTYMTSDAALSGVPWDTIGDPSAVSVGALWDAPGVPFTALLVLNVIPLALSYPYFRGMSRGASPVG